MSGKFGIPPGNRYPLLLALSPRITAEVNPACSISFSPLIVIPPAVVTLSTSCSGCEPLDSSKAIARAGFAERLLEPFAGKGPALPRPPSLPGYNGRRRRYRRSRASWPDRVAALPPIPLCPMHRKYSNQSVLIFGRIQPRDERHALLYFDGRIGNCAIKGSVFSGPCLQLFQGNARRYRNDDLSIGPLPCQMLFISASTIQGFTAITTMSAVAREL